MLLLISILLAAFLTWKQARTRGLSEEKIFDIFLLTLFFSLIGARIGYVLTHWSVFSEDFSRIFLLLRYPGLSFPAGLIAGVAVAAFGGFQILDIFAMAFSWTAPRGVYLLAVAVLMWFLDKKISKKKPGWFFSAYLIFFLPSLLIVPKWVLILEIPAVILFMIKFPTDVLNQIKNYLEQKRQETEHRLKDLKKEDPFEDKSRLLDRASDDREAQSKAGHERVAALQQQLNLILIQTRKALTKIKIGNYGVCENCHKMIDTDRLAAMPAAVLCLNCEKKREK